MKKSILILLTTVILMTFTACKPPDAFALADKINDGYNTRLEFLGGTVKQFSAKTTVKFEFSDIVRYENYSIDYNSTNNLHAYRLSSDQSSATAEFEEELNEYYYYGGYTMSFRTPKGGVRAVEGYPAVPYDFLGGGDAFANFTTHTAKRFMPAEVFSRDALDNLKAVKKGSRIFVTAKGKVDSLGTIRQGYFADISGKDYNLAGYVGSKSVTQLDSITFEYIIKGDKITKKTVIMEGMFDGIDEQSVITKLPVKVTQVVDYSYTASVNIPAELMAVVG